MNQTTNLIQWKNHTDEQKAEFDFENYAYEIQCDLKWFDIRDFEGDEVVYRLKIEPEKWYCLGMGKNEQIAQGQYILSGSYHTDFQTTLLRPAKPEEVPKPKVLTLEDRVKFQYADFDVVMLKWHGEKLLKIYRYNFDHLHTAAQSMKGFAGYVYEIDGVFKVIGSPNWQNTDKGFTMPIATLFTGGEE